VSATSQQQLDVHLFGKSHKAKEAKRLTLNPPSTNPKFQTSDTSNVSKEGNGLLSSSNGVAPTVTAASVPDQINKVSAKSSQPRTKVCQS